MRFVRFSDRLMNSADTLGLLSHVCLLRSVSSNRVTEHVFGFEKYVTTQN